MIEQAAEIQDQVSQLQARVQALQRRLAQAPKYFDDPLADPLSP